MAASAAAFAREKSWTSRASSARTTSTSARWYDETHLVASLGYVEKLDEGFVRQTLLEEELAKWKSLHPENARTWAEGNGHLDLFERLPAGKAPRRSRYQTILEDR